MHFTFEDVKLSVFQKVLNFRSSHLTEKVFSIVNNSSDKRDSVFRHFGRANKNNTGTVIAIREFFAALGITQVLKKAMCSLCPKLFSEKIK